MMFATILLVALGVGLLIAFWVAMDKRQAAYTSYKRQQFAEPMEPLPQIYHGYTPTFPDEPAPTTTYHEPLQTLHMLDRHYSDNEPTYSISDGHDIHHEPPQAETTSQADFDAISDDHGDDD